jgi:hypothetical protein|nr:MAG TPA: hypothetical protein [Caudoviricetes sp.]
MAINKVEYGGNTLIDLTSDSVTPENLISGVTAHDASGKKITGNFDSNKYLEKTGDASDTTVTFVQATNRANISSKEKNSVIMGKIAKFFADLKTVAFTGKYSDLSGTPGIVSKTANGLCPKYGGTTTKFLRDDGTYAEPTASVSGLSTLEQVTAAATAGNVTDPVGAGAVNELNSSFGGLKFGKDSDGNYGYIKDGADTVIPFSTKCPYIVDSIIGVGHITGAGHYVRVLGGRVTFAPNGCKTFTISRMKLGNTYFSISEITNGTYTLSDDNTAYIITPIDNTLDVITKWSEIRIDGELTMCFIKSYT